MIVNPCGYGNCKSTECESCRHNKIGELTMTFDEALDEIASQNEENKKLIEQAKIDAQIEMLLEQAKDSKVMYYPQVEGITPTVI